jgi:hypothetical protein
LPAGGVLVESPVDRVDHRGGGQGRQRQRQEPDQHDAHPHPGGTGRYGGDRRGGQERADEAFELAPVSLRSGLVAMAMSIQVPVPRRGMQEAL